MLITKYKFQIILFSFYTFQTFQVHPHRIIISHSHATIAALLLAILSLGKRSAIIRIILLYSSEPLP